VPPNEQASIVCPTTGLQFADAGANLVSPLFQSNFINGVTLYAMLSLGVKTHDCQEKV